jgi:four helix bundle protein
MIKSHKDLDVWQRAIGLSEMVYRATAGFPREETYGLTSQMRRAAVSVAANIAEGFGRDQTGTFVQFLRIALGSVRELDTHVVIASRVGHLESDSASPLARECDDLSKMLRSLIRRLEAKKDEI